MTTSRTRGLLLAGLLALVFAVSGCFTMSDRAKAGQTRNDVVCQDTPPTGSHIARTQCYRQVQVEERGENDREKIRKLQIGGAVKPENFN